MIRLQNVNGVEKMENTENKVVYFYKCEIKRKKISKKIPKYIFGIEEAKDFFIKEIAHNTIESMIVLFMDSMHEIVAVSEIGKGSSSKLIIDNSEIFRIAILCNAKYILIGHNHPNSQITPSDIDIKTTKEIGFIASMLGIELIDSVIVNYEEQYFSIRQNIKKTVFSNEKSN